MKKYLKINYKVVGMLLLMAILTLVFPIVSNASLQSRPNATSLTNKTASDFFLLCRQMETSSGPLGLNATIEVQDNKVVETSNSNGIDVHMIKNTEYGTAAMLAASAYGECKNSVSATSTTQNESGIILKMSGGQFIYVAGIYDKYNSYNTYIYNADAKYKNVYNSNVAEDSYIPGDATYETKKWKDTSWASFVSSSSPVFERCFYGVFGFNSSVGNFNSWRGSRAVVVCGAGL